MTSSHPAATIVMAKSAGEAPKAPLKRSLFNKPAWSRPQKLASPAEFFHRSSSSYIDIATEAERKRKAKLARKQAERVKGDPDEIGNGEAKRQRISSDSEDDSDGTSGQSDRDTKAKSFKEEKPCQGSLKPGERNASRTTTAAMRDSSSKSFSKRYEASINTEKAEAQPKPPSSNIIELEDSSDEEAAPDEAEDYKPTQANRPPPPEEDDFPASDDEYAELARKAREKARRKRLEDDVISVTHNLSPSAEPEGNSQRVLSAHQSAPPPPPPDPEVHILITSPLENSKPLIIKRKLSQRLKDVRATWCQHQQFTADMTSTIFLTWRGKRLFDVTSCKSLGIAVDADGNVSTEGQKKLFGEEEQKIHMEAMTEKLLEERKNAKRRKTEEEQGNVEDEETDTSEKPQELQVRIILKAKGFEDFKLIVKPVSRASIRETTLNLFKLTVSLVYPHIPNHCSLPSGQSEGNRRQGRLSIVRWRAFGAHDKGRRDRAQRYGPH